MSRAEETLRGQLPEYFRPIIEFREILKAHGYSLDKLDETSEKVKDNNYIATCDEETIAYYEKLLGITYRFGVTMEYRRARVLQKYNTIVPFSIEFLRDKLTELYGEDGYEMSVDSAACKPCKPYSERGFPHCGCQAGGRFPCSRSASAGGSGRSSSDNSKISGTYYNGTSDKPGECY